jgi:hypothetical protein
MSGSLTFTLSNVDGPVVTVQIGPDLILRDAYSQANRSSPSAAPAKLLVDTGADRTSIHRSVFAGWIITGSRLVQVIVNGAIVDRECFDVALSILDKAGRPIVHIDPLEITITDSAFFAKAGFKGLLGRDVLNLGTFLYDAPHGQCVLTF